MLTYLANEKLNWIICDFQCDRNSQARTFSKCNRQFLRYSPMATFVHVRLRFLSFLYKPLVSCQQTNNNNNQPGQRATTTRINKRERMYLILA